MVVSASSLSGISWFEAAGAVHAENQTLRFLADLAGLPPSAGGCFVQGGSAGEPLRARGRARHRAAPRPTDRLARIAVSEQTHSSIANTMRLLDVQPLLVATDDDRMTGATLAQALRPTPTRAPSSRSRPRRARRTRASSTISPASPRVCARPRPVDARRRRVRRRRAARAERPRPLPRHRRAPIRSSSIRTSGCSRRSTAPRSSTANRGSPARCTRRTRRTST